MEENLDLTLHYLNGSICFKGAPMRLLVKLLILLIILVGLTWTVTFPELQIENKKQLNRTNL